MCFDNDADWYAEINDVTDADNGPECKCYECSARISEQDWRRSIHQQEYESCQQCDSELGTAECDHDYGETFEAVLCRNCCRLLEAIKAVEIAAVLGEGE